jgi:hypothetical protein
MGSAFATSCARAGDPAGSGRVLFARVAAGALNTLEPGENSSGSAASSLAWLMLCSRRARGRPRTRLPCEFVADQLPHHVAQDRHDGTDPPAGFAVFASRRSLLAEVVAWPGPTCRIELPGYVRDGQRRDRHRAGARAEPRPHPAAGGFHSRPVPARPPAVPAPCRGRSRQGRETGRPGGILTVAWVGADKRM